jgi:anti-sigma regulatory factor (Ser/Thr protein kinase)
MDRNFFTSYKIEDRSYLAMIKREIHKEVLRAGFPPARAAEIDIIVAELTSNLIKYAGGGELLFRLEQEKGLTRFETICLDDGDGMVNVPQMMRDGVSTGTSLGQGLGAIHRLSDLFQVYSLKQWGTVAYSKVFSRKQDGPPPSARPWKAQMLSTPKPGEDVCGDGFFVKEFKGGIQFFHGDGLGHGLQAYEAVRLAIAAFKICPDKDPPAVLRFIHNEVKKSRGLVGMVAALDFKTGVWKFCGIGNIAARIYEGLVFKSFMSYNGILGLHLPGALSANEYAGQSGQCLIMGSDGLRSNWDLSRYPGVLKYDSTILAAILYKDYGRKTDDASVLVGKINFLE